jgi:hypothetical protein
MIAALTQLPVSLHLALPIDIVNAGQSVVPRSSEKMDSAFRREGLNDVE